MHRIVRILHGHQHNTVDAAPHKMPRVCAESGTAGVARLGTGEDDRVAQEGRIDVGSAGTQLTVRHSDHRGGEDHEHDDRGRDQHTPRQRDRGLERREGQRHHGSAHSRRHHQPQGGCKPLPVARELRSIPACVLH